MRLATATTARALDPIEVPNNVISTIKGVFCGTSIISPATAIAAALMAPPMAACRSMSDVNGTPMAFAPAAAAATAAAVVRPTSKMRVATKMATCSSRPRGFCWRREYRWIWLYTHWLTAWYGVSR